MERPVAGSARVSFNATGEYPLSDHSWRLYATSVDWPRGKAGHVDFAAIDLDCHIVVGTERLGLAKRAL
jgi:hypothetical protein